METREDQETVAKGLAKVERGAEFLSISRSSFYALIEKGDIATVKIGRSRRVPWAELERFAARHLELRQPPQEPLGSNDDAGAQRDSRPVTTDR